MRKQKMLIVEDDKTSAFVLAKYYNSFEVKIATNSDECQEAIRRFSPNIVLLDYHLPGKNGDELYKIIKQAHPKAHVIVLSANDSSKTVVELVKLGVRDYVIKGDDALDEIDKILKEAAEEAN